MRWFGIGVRKETAAVRAAVMKVKEKEREEGRLDTFENGIRMGGGRCVRKARCGRSRQAEV